MRTKLKLLIYLFVGLVAASCSDDDGARFIEVETPSEIDATFMIAQDNSGDVTITPTATGASSFIVEYGDGSGSSESIAAGEQVTHTYEEGSYEVTIIAFNLQGTSATATKTLEVSFAPPTNLQVTITQEEENDPDVTVEATAENASMFNVDFGDGSEPVSFMPEESASYEYAEEGTYTITVTAMNASSETLSYTEEVNVVIEETEPDPVALAIPLTFEGDPESYVFTEFEGAPTSVVANPDTNGNSSAQVAMTERAMGAANYAGAFILLEESPDFANNAQITMKVWSPAAGIPVTLRFEDPSDNTMGVEAEVNTTVANQWETVTLDFSEANDSPNFTKMVIFFNLGTDGQGNTYYFDDIEYGDGEGEEPIEDPVTFPLNFEDSNIAYEWVAFGGNTAQVIANPEMSGINTSSMVTEMVKPTTAETWSGASIILDEPIDVTGSTTFTMKVWSPISGAPVLLKLEEDATDYAMEVQATTTTANQWEELTFDFTGISTTNDIDVISIFMNFNVAGQGNTYYLDDIQLQ